LVSLCSTLYRAYIVQVLFLDLWIIQHAEYHAETLNTRDMQNRELRDYYILNNRRKGSKNNRKGMRKKKRQPQLEQGKQGPTVWVSLEMVRRHYDELLTELHNIELMLVLGAEAKY